MELKPGPEVIKLFSCSAQLSIKFKLPRNVKTAKINVFFQVEIILVGHLSCS